MTVRKPLVHQSGGRIAELPTADSLPMAQAGAIGRAAVGGYMNTTMGAGGSTTVQTGAANRMEVFPWRCAYSFNCDLAAVNCTTAVAGALAKVIVYGSDNSDYPNNLLVETDTVDLSALGVKTVPLVWSFEKGAVYWLGIRHSLTGALSHWPLQSTPDISGQTSVLTTAAKTLRQTLAFATPAPATWGFNQSQIGAFTGAAIRLRVAS